MTEPAPLPYTALAAAAELLDGSTAIDSRSLDNWNGPAVLMTLPGLTLDIHNGSEAGRMTVTVELSAELNKYTPGSKDRPAIGLSTSRSAAQIAAEISRRLLPEAREYLALTELNQIAAHERLNALVDLAARLIAAGSRPDADQRDPAYRWTGQAGSRSTRAEVIAHAGGSVEIKLQTPDSDFAAAILRTIEEFTAADRAAEQAAADESARKLAEIRAQREDRAAQAAYRATHAAALPEEE